MTQYQCVNETGLRALNALSYERPDLFIDADSNALIDNMTKRADTPDVWGVSLDLGEDISSLNQVQQSGPETDAQYARLVRSALALPPSEGLNEHRWATINCFVLPKYVSMRWAHVQPAEPEKLSGFVKRHWLDGGQVSARQDNSIARLWWLGEFSARAAEHTSMYSADELLDAMAHNVNLYHQLLARPNLLARPKLVAAIYEMFLEPDNEYLRTTRYANELLGSLNFTAAQISLDFMDASQLRTAVEEAKPPKEP